MLRIELDGVSYLVSGIQRQEPGEVAMGDLTVPTQKVEGCTGFRVVGGMKAFIRCWDNGAIDWGWGMHATAKWIWLDPDDRHAWAAVNEQAGTLTNKTLKEQIEKVSGPRDLRGG